MSYQALHQKLQVSALSVKSLFFRLTLDQAKAILDKLDWQG